MYTVCCNLCDIWVFRVPHEDWTCCHLISLLYFLLLHYQRKMLVEIEWTFPKEGQLSNTRETSPTSSFPDFSKLGTQFLQLTLWVLWIEAFLLIDFTLLNSRAYNKIFNWWLRFCLLFVSPRMLIFDLNLQLLY